MPKLNSHKSLTDKEIRVYGVLVAYNAINKAWPSLKIIADSLNYPDGSYIYYPIKRLERKGVLMRIDGGHRQYRLDNHKFDELMCETQNIIIRKAKKEKENDE